MPPDAPAPDKLSIVVFSGDFERVHYALAMASAAVATNRPATLFFTMGAIRALLADHGDGTPGWHALGPAEGGLGPGERDREFARRGVATFAELMDACRDLGVTFMVCEMGLRAMGLTPEELRGDIAYEEGGIVSFLADVSPAGQMVFI
ncbi:MAG: DsrE/DsrF/DrsH-like family protein [Alphaproteobacteria bacterium]